MGDRHLTACVLFWLGWGALDQGDYAAARRHLEESVALERRAGHPDRAAAAEFGSATCARPRATAHGARALHEEALAVWRGNGYTRGIAGALAALGRTAVALGDPAEARARYDECLVHFREPAVEQSPEYASRDLALIACALGEAGAARQLLQHAVAVWRAGARLRPARLPHRRRAGRVRGPGRRPRPAGAGAAAGGAADGLREASGRPRAPLYQGYLDRRLEPARRALDDGAAGAALAAGRALTLDQAIAEAADWPPAAAGSGGAPPLRPGPPACAPPIVSTAPDGHPPPARAPPPAGRPRAAIRRPRRTRGARPGPAGRCAWTP